MPELHKNECYQKICRASTFHEWRGALYACPRRVLPGDSKNRSCSNSEGLLLENIIPVPNIQHLDIFLMVEQIELMNIGLNTGNIGLTARKGDSIIVWEVTYSLE